MRKLIYTAVLGLSSSFAFAHSELTASMPADMSSLDAAPKEVMLHFSEPVRLTSLVVTHAGEAQKEMGPLPSERKKDFSVASPGLSKGQYKVSWRALSEDAHAMTGEFTFAVGEAVANHEGHTAEHSAHGEHGAHSDAGHNEKH